MSDTHDKAPIARRFRGFLPIVIDVETGGFNPKRDALLEIAAVLLDMDEQGIISRKETISCHIEPFPGANLDMESLEFTGIDPYNPFRMARPELDALEHIFKPVRRAIKDSGCSRAVLVGHNAAFEPSRRPALTGTVKKHIPPFMIRKRLPIYFALLLTSGMTSA